MKKTYENNQNEKDLLAFFETYYSGFSEELKEELDLDAMCAKILELKKEKEMSTLANKFLKIAERIDSTGDKLIMKTDEVIKGIDEFIEKAKLFMEMMGEEQMNDSETVARAKVAAQYVIETGMLLIQEQGVDFVLESFPVFCERLEKALELLDKQIELEIMREERNELRDEYEWYKEEYESLVEEYESLMQ